MASFLRYLLAFVAGTAVGAVAILLTHPGFSVVVTSVPPAAPAVASAPVTPPAPVAPKPAVASVPAPVVVAEAPKPVAPKPAEVPPAPVVKETAPAGPGLDFAALNERPVFWPASVVLTSATNAPLVENGKRIGELPLTAGTVLQVSKVLADGTLEVRAKGMKFEVSSKLTDFETLVRRKIQELIEKDAKVLAPLVRDAMAATPVAVAPAPTPVAPVAPVAEEAPKPAPRAAPVTLDDKMNALFGRRPAPVEKTETAPAPTPTPAKEATPAPVEPTPAPVDTKAQEKKADLDRRMNGLFGTPAK